MERQIALLWWQAYFHKLSFKQPICIYMLSFFEIPKEVLKNLIFIDLDSSGKGMVTKKIDYPNGIYYVDQKNKADWELWI